MGVSPDGSRLWVITLGLKLRGGNSVSVYADLVIPARGAIGCMCILKCRAQL